MNIGLLSQLIRDLFERSGFVVDPNAEINVITTGVEWRLVDRKNTRVYTINHSSGTLAFDLVLNSFIEDYSWVKFVKLNGAIEYGTIVEFITARQTGGKYKDLTTGTPNFNWPDFKNRMDDVNDKSVVGSRSGDIMIFTDGRAGYLTVNDGDEDFGWHGGATAAESEVPMMFNIPGSVVKKGFLSDAIPSGTLANWQLSSILEDILIGLFNVE